MGNASDEDLRTIREQVMAATKIQAAMRAGKQTKQARSTPTTSQLAPKPVEEAKLADCGFHV